MTEKQIKFKDLSAWVKVAIIFAWVNGALAISAFLIGFFAELLSPTI